MQGTIATSAGGGREASVSVMSKAGAPHPHDASAEETAPEALRARGSTIDYATENALPHGSAVNAEPTPSGKTNT